MYRNCIFCSAGLGSNDTLEAFPVGRRLAFDAWKGRLWVVCGRCHRWNLAPIEERWEAVEAAEKTFRDTRIRAQSENIGLARLADGTTLVRIGEALPNELAVWRYGEDLVRRRRHHLYGLAAAGAAGVALVAGMPLIAAAGVPAGLLSGGFQLAAQVQQARQRRAVVLRMDAGESPTGAPLLVRRHHLWDATVRGEGETLSIRLPDVLAPPPLLRPVRGGVPVEPVLLEGARAERLVARALVAFNDRGGSRNAVSDALARLERAGSAQALLAAAGGEGVLLARRPRQPAQRPMPSLRQIAGTFRGEVLPVTRYRSPFEGPVPALDRVSALALEMALHEESERRALDGQLAELEAAWREAEEIAAIADALPDEPQAPSSPSSRSTAAAKDGTRAKPLSRGSTTS